MRNSMDLYFKETGEENSQTILFLHGGALSGWMWEKQLDAFKDYHCLVPDLPEHGKSVNVKPFTIENASNQILNLIKNKAHNGRAHVVGVSLGAQIIVKMLSIAPELIDHAFISGTLVRRLPATPEILKLIDYVLKVYMPLKDSNFFIKANIRSYNLPKDQFQHLKEATNVLNSESLMRILNENMLFKIPDGLEKTENPVLVVAGGKEYDIMKKSVQDLSNVLPNSKGYIVSNMVHVWNMASPELFNEVLRAWITDQRLPEGLVRV